MLVTLLLASLPTCERHTDTCTTTVCLHGSTHRGINIEQSCGENILHMQFNSRTHPDDLSTTGIPAIPQSKGLAAGVTTVYKTRQHL